jgi:hypothetical protein
VSTSKVASESTWLTVGTVCRMAPQDIERFLNALESVPNVKLVFQKVARYNLYISPYPPSDWQDQHDRGA